jgi:hypothetical protein
VILAVQRDEYTLRSSEQARVVMMTMGDNDALSLRQYVTMLATVPASLAAHHLCPHM